jgi:hypothetical protein
MVFGLTETNNFNSRTCMGFREPVFNNKLLNSRLRFVVTAWKR